MKKWALAASVALLTACSAPQQAQIDFHPKATLSHSSPTKHTTYNLVSRDLRSAQYVALVDSGHSHIEPIHARQNFRIALETALQDQLASQGLETSVNSKNTITLEIQDALINVKHSVISNGIKAHVVLALTAETPQGKLVKTYTSKAQRSGAFSASQQDIEIVLNDTVNLALKEIANDQELQHYIQERF